MRILTFTSLFPNAKTPTFGVFIYQRMSHVAIRPGTTLHVIAPVPYFPGWLPTSKWHYSQVPKHETIGDLSVYHPRYPLLPKISMPLHGLLMFLGTFLLARRLHRQFRFDCIDAHYVFPDGVAATLIGRMLGIPVIVSARGTDITQFPSFKTIRPQIRWVLKKAAGVIGVCTALTKIMIDLGADPDRARTIGNGVDISRFQPLDRREARRHLGLPLNAKTIVSVGALVPHKGHQLTIAALRVLAESHADLHLYIVGEGHFRKTLERQAREAGMGHIHLVGVRPNEELKYWYSAADVSCLASSREGWANVLLESMACGTAAVATRVGGTPEVIRSADLGVLVEPNVDSILAGLSAALNKQWDREELVRYAASRTWNSVAQEVEEFFADVITNSASDRSSFHKSERSCVERL